MSPIQSTSGISYGSRDLNGASQALGDLDMDQFLKLMITELQNQDPLDPMENSEMLAQISQIREVGATDRLTDSLETMLLRQNVASATSLIGQHVEGRASDGQPAGGLVERVRIVDGIPQLQLDGSTTAGPEPGPGRIGPGTYCYRVTFRGVDAGGAEVLFAVDLGPVETTGSPEQDQAIVLSNLPLTDAPKSIYRTDASGSGDYYLVGQADGNASRYTDIEADSVLADRPILTAATTAHRGGRHFTITLDKVTEVRARADE